MIGGTFSSEENALRQEEKVRKAGVESYVKKRGDYYEVIIGTFFHYEGAKTRSRYFEDKGIETYI